MTTLFLGFALGIRHGTDPDHLAAIDGLSRMRPRLTNGIYFALGHGLVVTLLAVGIGQVVSTKLAFLGPWMLLFIGIVNVVKLFRTHSFLYDKKVRFPSIAQPFLLGILLAAGIETATQFSALILAGETNPWLLGLIFTGGMVLVDGVDGFLAAATQSRALSGKTNSRGASQVLGILVVLLSFGLGGAELSGKDLSNIGFPLGLTLFVLVVGIRYWARSRTHDSTLSKLNSTID